MRAHWTVCLTEAQLRSCTLHILFICTGNICRSPIAERIALLYASRSQIIGFGASSAGTRAMVSHPMHAEAARALSDLGGYPGQFTAQHLTTRVAVRADLILTMTKAHRDQVLELVPSKFARTFTLSEAAFLASANQEASVTSMASLRATLRSDELYDIPDPMGQSREVFTAVASQIAALMPPIIELCSRT